jgi:two-component system NarL family sensor kinase
MASDTMTLRWKIVVLAIVPLLVATGVVAREVFRRANRLSEQQVALIEQSLMEQKRQELMHAVTIVESQIAAIVGEEPDEARAKGRVQQLLTTAGYEEDGYFFANDLSGVCVAHGRKPELVGTNIWELKDPHGRPVVQWLQRAAREGDGFVAYEWEKPSTKQVADKLSYVRFLPKWGWVFGTGVYVDDVARAGHTARKDARQSIERTMGQLAVVSLLAIALVFVGTMVLNVNEQRLADGRLRTANRMLETLRRGERERIARDLHEGTSQLLAATKFRFELVGQQMDGDVPKAHENLALGLERLAECIEDVRRVSHALAPVALDKGWLAALNERFDEFRERKSAALRFTETLGEAPPEPYASEIYQIVQEALTNVERHSDATEIDISVARGESDEIVLRVVDNGRGFSPERSDDERRWGIGLRNLRARVEDMNGAFELTSRPGRTELLTRLRIEAVA